MNGGQYRSNNAYDYHGTAVRSVREERVLPREPHERPKKMQKKAQALKTAQNASTWKSKLKMMTAVSFIFICSLLVVYRYVLIWETGANAEKLKNTYAAIEAENENVQAQLNTGVDLKELEKIAHERLGMIRPQRYQMFYIDMQNNDRSETVEEEEPSLSENSVPVTSVPGMLISALELLK